MIKTITVKNYLGKEMTLELMRPEKSGLIVASIDGLGPAKAVINITDISTNDGGTFNSSRLEKRNIVNQLYDALKWMAMYLLPAAGTLYFALAGIWNLPYGEQIVGTITAIDTFLGVILGISTVQYNKENSTR